VAFTYSDALTADRDRVRFRLGDTLLDAGPKPADANFSDEEIDDLLDDEGSWQRAVAGAFETLAALWARHVSFSADGLQMNQSDIADKYAASAAIWRGRHGTSAVGSCGSASAIRADGYSDDLDNVTA
jgi:hypothetical protein